MSWTLERSESYALAAYTRGIADEPLRPGDLVALTPEGRLKVAMDGDFRIGSYAPQLRSDKTEFDRAQAGDIVRIRIAP